MQNALFVVRWDISLGHVQIILKDFMLKVSYLYKKNLIKGFIYKETNGGRGTRIQVPE